MKKVVMVMVMAMVASAALALEWHKCVSYYARTDANAKWTLQDDGNGVYIKRWSSTLPKPTVAELSSNEVAAVAWYDDQVNDKEADYTANWTKREMAMMKLLVKEINLLRAAAGLQPRTAAQVKAALKAEME